MARKQPSKATRLENAIEKIREGLGEISDLKDEIGDWRDNLTGTNLENSQKYTDLEECYDALESYDNDIESTLSELESVEFPRAFG